ncbi:hypothetical protein Vretifemale_4130, partial [Volvox reticuliferus]
MLFSFKNVMIFVGIAFAPPVGHFLAITRAMNSSSHQNQTYIWRRMSAAAAAATPGGDSRGPRVGDLPRSRSVQQEQLAEGSDFESTATTGRPAAWPARSPDAPPDPATRRGGRETMPDERAAEEAARMTIRHGSGKSADAIMAGWVRRIGDWERGSGGPMDG